MSGQDVTGWRWWLWPLRSRKVQVAIATVVAAWFAHGDLPVTETVIMAIIASGMSLILGIAHEDAGKKE